MDEREGCKIISIYSASAPSAQDLVRFAAEGTALAGRLIGYGELQAALTALDTAHEMLGHALRHSDAP